MSVATCVYRIYDNSDQLLYVGMTHDPMVRMKTHRANKSWADDISYVAVQWFNTREEAFSAEREAIAADRPIYNVTDWVSCVEKASSEAVFDGPQMLIQWMVQSGVSQAYTAKKLGVQLSTLSRIIRGKRIPTVKDAVAIENTTGISRLYWGIEERQEARRQQQVGSSGGSSKVKSSSIKVRATPEEREYANAVAKAAGKNLSTILREAIDRLARRHGVTFDAGKSERETHQ